MRESGKLDRRKRVQGVPRKEVFGFDISVVHTILSQRKTLLRRGTRGGKLTQTSTGLRGRSNEFGESRTQGEGGLKRDRRGGKKMPQQIKKKAVLPKPHRVEPCHLFTGWQRRKISQKKRRGRGSFSEGGVIAAGMGSEKALAVGPS